MSDYRDNKSRAQDNKSSAWVLTIIGILGLVVSILGFFKVIPFRVGNPYFFYGIITALFLVFIVMGVVSFINGKKFERKVSSEVTVYDSIISWAKKNLTAEIIDSKIDASDSDEEEMYFKRIELISGMINSQFVNLEPEFVDNIIDNDIYDMLYGKSVVVYDYGLDEEEED